VLMGVEIDGSTKGHEIFKQFQAFALKENF
jgi:hypothetical protein